MLRRVVSRLLLAVIGLASSYVETVDCSCLGVASCHCESMHSSPNQVINCRNAGLSSVPTFDPNQHSSAIFHELTLAGNQIRSIPANAFCNVSIESLDLSDNPLSVIDPRSFSGLDPTLRRLFLSLSSDAPFPVAALASVRSVTVLHISGFSGRALPNGALYGLSALTELEIVNGGLTNIAADDLADQLFKLQRLSLSGNSLMSMPTVAIGQMMSLRSIDLSRNRIRKIGPKAFGPGLIRLETIDLSNNGLGASVDEMAFVDVANSLTSIRMQHCQLTDRSVLSLRSLGNALREIRLDYNSIANLPSDMLDNMRQLRTLNLDHNRLTSLSSATFNGVSKTLEVVYLSYNPLDGTAVSASLAALSVLSELYLDGIFPLRLSSSSFNPLVRKSLKLLSVRDSQLGNGNLWPTVYSLPALQTLLASRCALTTIPDFAFQRNSVLRAIDLSDNSLSAALTPAQVYGLPVANMQSFNLNGNGLTTIDRCTFHGMPTPSLSQIGLTANPLSCTDCSMQWLYLTLKNVDEFHTSSSTWTCSDGRLFSTLSEADFATCPRNSAATNGTNCTSLQSPNDGAQQQNDDNLISLSIHNASRSECLLQWRLTNETLSAREILGFMLSFELLIERSTSDANFSSTTTTASEWLSSDKRQYCNITNGILPNVGLYKVCLTASVDHRAVNHSTRVCSVVWINDATDTSSAPFAESQQVVVAISSVTGGLASLVAIVVVIICCRRSTVSRHIVSKTTPSNQVAWSATETTDEAVKINESEKRSSTDERVFRESCYFDKPHIRSDSKRYVRSPGKRQPSSAGGTCHVRDVDALTVSNGRGQPSNGDSFVLSADERARILSMLTAATQVDAAVPRSSSSVVDARRARRRSTGSPEVKLIGASSSNSPFDGGACVDSGLSAPDLHIYEDIPGDS